MGKIKRTTATNVKQILANTELQYSVGVQIKGTGIIKAGSPIGGTTNALKDSKAVLEVVDDENVQGVLLHDVNTAETTNGTMLVFGFVNLFRVDESVVIGEEVEKALDGKVTFLKRNK